MAKRGGGFRSESGIDPAVGARALIERVARAKREMMTAAGLELVAQIKRELSTPGTGRRYRLSHLSRRNAHGQYARSGSRRLFRWHRASAPGQPPAVNTGAFRASIDMEVTRTGVRVGTNDKRAPWFEDGTEKSGGHMAARPFMRPAVKKVRTAMGEQVKGVLHRAVTRGARGGR